MALVVCMGWLGLARVQPKPVQHSRLSSMHSAQATRAVLDVNRAPMPRPMAQPVPTFAVGLLAVMLEPAPAPRPLAWAPPPRPPASPEIAPRALRGPPAL